MKPLLIRWVGNECEGKFKGQTFFLAEEDKDRHIGFVPAGKYWNCLGILTLELEQYPGSWIEEKV